MGADLLPGGFWGPRVVVNASQAIFHQWKQLEASGCLQNFRVAANLRNDSQADGVHMGWFFADSDAYKWLEAAARINADEPNPRLGGLIDSFIDLLSQAQMPDGYLFTYNQIFFPETRWQNLQIEHELYCHGHLIEAGVTHFETTGRTDLLEIARRAANRITEDFRGKGPDWMPGHEEIEIALLRLYQLDRQNTALLETARQFIEQRGRNRALLFLLLRQNSRVEKRKAAARLKREEYLAGHPEACVYRLPSANPYQKQPGSGLRQFIGYLTGQYFQQHAPIRKQRAPVGHSVRFAYFEIAAAMLARLTGDDSLTLALERVWERMITRRMYVTGGLGSVPITEGFGRDYELDPQFAYAETCAALGSLFWSWEMVQLTGRAAYTDLLEWQLYNAALVGMSDDGTSYFYNNPLACHGEVKRQPWFEIPCCPSNISRTWANLSKYITSNQPGQLTLHQYISSRIEEVIDLPDGNRCSLKLSVHSELPWQGHLSLMVDEADYSGGTQPFDLRLRWPSWAADMRMNINGESAEITSKPDTPLKSTASGFDPRAAVFQSSERVWQSGDRVDIHFSMPVRLLTAHPRVKGHQGRAAITRGPLVYCLESVDQPGIDIFNCRVDADSLTPSFDPSVEGGMLRLLAKTTGGDPLIMIPYYSWGNRGPSQMTVWVNISK